MGGTRHLAGGSCIGLSRKCRGGLALKVCLQLESWRKESNMERGFAGLYFVSRAWLQFANHVACKYGPMLLILLVFRLASLAAQEAEVEPYDDQVALLLTLNKQVKPIEGTDTRGNKAFFDNRANHQAMVIVFLDFRCPVSNRMIPELNELAVRYKGPEVAFYGVVCDGVTPTELAKKSEEYKIGFRVFHDPKHAIANHYRATTTPQVFVLDKNRILRYIGAVNDQYPNRTTRLIAPAKHYLANTLEQLLSSREVVPSSTESVGCPLSRVRRPVVGSGFVTFHKDVEPLLQKHCQRCHRHDNVAPFTLLTFEEALNWADDIREFVSARKMPPWPITGGVPLKNDISLKADEITTICKWVDEGCPRGDPKDAPKSLPFKSEEGWDDAKPPDLVLKMPGIFHLAAKGEDHYRTVVFPLGNKEERYIRKIQFVPGNKKVIHHGLIFFDGTGAVLEAQNRLGKARPLGLGDEDYGPGYESGMGLGFIPDPATANRNKNNPGGDMGGWVTGAGMLEYPSGARSLIPPDSSIFLQIHYHRSGKPEVDGDTRLAVWFDKEKPAKYVVNYLADASFRMVPKGVDHFRSTGSRVIPMDSQLWLIAPHMHKLGKEFRVWHQAKDSAQRKLLLELKNWDFNWQSRYLLKDNHFMEKGSTIHVEAIFDNSSNNPNNPFSPPRNVFLGESSTNEMGFAKLGIVRSELPFDGGDMLKYFRKIMEAKKLQDRLDGTVSP